MKRKPYKAKGTVNHNHGGVGWTRELCQLISWLMILSGLVAVAKNILNYFHF